jgi:hypothetical protein
VISVEKREVRSNIMHDGELGVFVHDKYFLRREHQCGDFTSLSHSEAVDIVVGLLRHDAVRNAVSNKLPRVVVSSYDEIVLTHQEI